MILAAQGIEPRSLITELLHAASYTGTKIERFDTEQPWYPIRSPTCASDQRVNHYTTLPIECEIKAYLRI